MAGRTVTGQLIEAHRVDGDEELLALAVDQALIEDATGTMTALQFEPLGVERCRVPLAVCYVDHNVLQVDERNYAQGLSKGSLETTPGRRSVVATVTFDGVSKVYDMLAFLGPLIGLLTVGRGDGFARGHAVAALRFNLSVAFNWLAFTAIGAQRAATGQTFTYPLTLRAPRRNH